MIYINTAVLTSLDGESDYEYQIGFWPLWSQVYRFSGRTPGKHDAGPVDLAVFGDWGTGPVGAPTLDLLERLRPELDGLFLLGDIAYDLEWETGRIGDEFGNMIEPIAARIPFMTIPGNHDYFQNATHYKERYLMPKNYANQGNNSFYKLGLGDALFIFFNTEVYFRSKEVERW
jgi:hypothetical protein